MDIQQLMDALNQQRQQMVGSQINLETMYPEWERANTRSRQGLISGLIESAWDSRKRKQLEPEYRGALSAAMDAEAGYNDLAAQLEALQAAQQAEAERAAKLEDYEAQKKIDQRYREPKAPPNLIRSLMAAGIDPQSEQGRAIIQQNLMKSGVTVKTGNEGPQVGTIPQGYQLAKDESGAWRMEPIAGGPAEVELQEAQDKLKGRQRQATMAGNVVLRETDRAFDLIDKMHQGEGIADRYWRAGRAKVKGTPEEILMSSVLAPIKAELGFARIQQMRENSPTGGSLGNVSNFEVDNLQKTAGQFDADMPLPMLKENLADLRTRFLDTIHGTADQRAELVARGVVTPEENAEIEALYGQQDSSAEPQAEAGGEIYYNPQTGEKIRWDGKQWVRVQ